MSFQGETALGDGVLREVFLTFWDSFSAQFCDGNKQFAFVPHPSLTDEDYAAVRKIMSHQFLPTGAFPVQVAAGTDNSDIVWSSQRKASSHLMPERECQREGREEDSPFPSGDIVVILSEYNVMTFPTASNLPRIVKQV